jgi:hypothetical protein
LSRTAQELSISVSISNIVSNQDTINKQPVREKMSQNRQKQQNMGWLWVILGFCHNEN